MSAFEFATAQQIVFGCGKLAELAVHACGLGSCGLLVTGSRPERADRARDLLEGAKINVVTLAVSKEPTTELARRGVELSREANVGFVIGMGGGSALDLAKAVAALAANGGDPLDYLEVVGRGRALSKPSLPCILIPTTAGTGSEVTRNAVLQAEAERVKVSLRSPHMLPKVALVDPELTLSVPRHVTAATGLDALTQVMEPYVSNARGALTDALCVEGMRRGARSLLRAYEDGSDLGAREDLCVTSLFGGLSLANAKLGAVHGLAGPLGGAFEAPHGALCARLLPNVMRANLRALEQRGHRELIERYRTIAGLLLGRPASPEEGIEWVEELVERLGIPRLAAHGVTSAHFEDIVAKGRRASSMKGNPVELAAEELTRVLEAAL
ncbi:MAG TPA: iron-containing alcohol dehydrogenase [Polyangiaceae bacterium]|nr:iron-containing alcohol dehydrogenase [Polyangiaceae bacterium]